MSRDLILLFISLFTWGIGEGLFFVFQPIYLEQLGANTMTIAGVYSAFGFAMMLAHIPAGYLSDRVGRKPLLVASWVLGLVATWVMALAHTLPIFIVGMLMYGLTAFVSSPLNSYVTAARGKLTPARAMTLMSASFNLGAIIGPVSGGWLGDHIGLRVVYLNAACLFIVSTLILLFIRSQARDSHDPSAPPEKLLGNKRYVGFLFIAFFIMFVTFLPQPLTAKFLENERGLSLGAIGVLGSINGFGNALFNLLLGFLPSRLGLVLVQACVALFSFLIWRGTGMLWYGLGYFMLGGYRSAFPFIFAKVRSLIHSSQMGLAYGLAATFNSLATVLAPLLAGLLYTRDPLMVYLASLGLIGIMMVVSGIATPGGKEIPQSAAAVDIHPLSLE